MTRYSTFLITTFLALAMGAAPAYADGALSGFSQKTVPVLVKVNYRGKVTSISPALELRPDFEKLIRQSIQEMITGPAKYRGQPISSQLVMFMVPETTARTDGQYDVRFTSVKNQPVPPGMWYWLNDNGHRLALANRSDQPSTGFGRSGHVRDSRYSDYSAPTPSNYSSTASRSSSSMGGASPSRGSEPTRNPGK